MCVLDLHCSRHGHQQVDGSEHLQRERGKEEGGRREGVVGESVGGMEAWIDGELEGGRGR